MLIGIIIACEIGFWVVLVAGLLSRYVLRRPRLGAALLICVPLVDLVLLAATTIDLAQGATAEFGHGLAAAYLGFSVAFGHSMIRSADARFAHRFAGGPPPAKPPKHGPERTRHEWRQFGKAALAWAIACGLLGVAILVVGDAERTAELQGWLGWLTIALAIWALAPITFTLWPRSLLKNSRRAPERVRGAGRSPADPSRPPASIGPAGDAQHPRPRPVASTVDSSTGS